VKEYAVCGWNKKEGRRDNFSISDNNQKRVVATGLPDIPLDPFLPVISPIVVEHGGFADC
jgi:hypothetical protein